MRFVDCVTLRTIAGHGGPGAIAFHREKFVEKGGPSGGNGGRGGSVLLEADENVGTLLDLRYRRRIAAPRGRSGGAKGKAGRSGADVRLRVPVGTIVRDAHTRELIADLDTHGAELVIVRGGRGGQGNQAFKSSTHQTPRFAQPGEPGEDRHILLELKLLADVGIIGYPSVGKSTLISVISNARPRIAAYPFTTLVPNLGIVRRKDFRSFVVADIPGLIDGAHEGRGLGYQFLRHVERCRILLHLIEITPGEGEFDDGRDPIRDFHAICNELERFSPTLAQRPQLVALAKSDVVSSPEDVERLRTYFNELGIELLVFSSATRAGLEELLDAMIASVDRTPPPDAAHFTAPEATIPDDDEDVLPLAWDDDGSEDEDGDEEEDDDDDA
jgi:GTP-binding protein